MFRVLWGWVRSGTLWWVSEDVEGSTQRPMSCEGAVGLGSLLNPVMGIRRGWGCYSEISVLWGCCGVGRWVSEEVEDATQRSVSCEGAVGLGSLLNPVMGIRRCWGFYSETYVLWGCCVVGFAPEPCDGYQKRLRVLLRDICPARVLWGWVRSGTLWWVSEEVEGATQWSLSCVGAVGLGWLLNPVMGIRRGWGFYSEISVLWGCCGVGFTPEPCDGYQKRLRVLLRDLCPVRVLWGWLHSWTLWLVSEEVEDATLRSLSCEGAVGLGWLLNPVMGIRRGWGCYLEISVLWGCCGVRFAPEPCDGYQKRLRVLLRDLCPVRVLCGWVHSWTLWWVSEEVEGATQRSLSFEGAVGLGSLLNPVMGIRRGWGCYSLHTLEALSWEGGERSSVGEVSLEALSFILEQHHLFPQASCFIILLTHKCSQRPKLPDNFGEIFAENACLGKYLKNECLS